MLYGDLEHLFWGPNSRKFLKTGRSTHFLPLVPYSSAPWWPIQKATTSFRAAWPKLPSLRVSSKYSNVEGNLSKKNPRTRVTCMRLADRLSQKVNHLASLGG